MTKSTWTPWASSCWVSVLGDCIHCSMKPAVERNLLHANAQTLGEKKQFVHGVGNMRGPGTFVPWLSGSLVCFIRVYPKSKSKL